MQITKLVLDNFSSYEGKNTFDFTVKRDKTIVLIGGQNGAGKTSIFTAIKIALYGPLAFGYTGNNAFYSKKIKSYINDRAFQSQSFSSGVSIIIKIKKEREVKHYKIERKWRIVDSKIEEEYNVFEGKQLLEESEKILFEGYILNIIPIDLFEFFLFDGEEVGNIFSSDGYNKYVKNALLTMCGIDDLEILQHFCKNYNGRNDNSEESELNEQYDSLLESISKLQEKISKTEVNISYNEKEKEELSTLIEQREAEFLRSGGIPPEKAKKLEDEIYTLDKKREVLARETKAFFEEIMPFYIMKHLIPPMKQQIKYEEKASIHEYIMNMISEEFIDKAIEDRTQAHEEVASAVYDAILSKFEVSNGIVDDMIFDLSKAEMGKLLNLSDSITDYDEKSMISAIKEREKIVKKISANRLKLKNALSEEDAKRYTDEIVNAKHRMEIIDLENQQQQHEIETLHIELDKLKNELGSVKERIRSNTQDRHTIDLSTNISIMMDKLINTSMISIRKQLSERIIENLHKIYRKENLISLIDISDNFKFELYQMQKFTIVDLRALISNIGIKEFYKTIGEESIHILRDYFSLDEDGDLETAIYFCNEDNEFELFKRIDLNMLSKGERQIFILSLYWAIIQISGKQIPFIIDTPYARIDANHREEISSKFFPNISSQVVILSTDEEINKEYHNIIKPYIAKEYLLTNNQSENKTTVTEGYFFKED